MQSICFLAAWSSRYRRRRAVIEGHLDYNDSLFDEIARALLIKRSLADDGQFVELPPFWSSEVIDLINLGLANNHAMRAIDVNSLSASHSYGPSLRRLWAEFRDQVEAKVGSKATANAENFYDYVVNWAKAIPSAYKAKKLLVRAKADLALLESPLRWALQEDLSKPWSCLHGQGELQVRLNDFPDQIMYNLIVHGRDAGAFHEWPAQWERMSLCN